MVDQAWIVDNIRDYLTDDNKYIEWGDGITTSVENFLKLFGGVSPTLSSLLERDMEDGDTKGFAPLFEEWKEKGLIE